MSQWRWLPARMLGVAMTAWNMLYTLNNCRVGRAALQQGWTHGGTIARLRGPWHDVGLTCDADVPGLPRALVTGRWAVAGRLLWAVPGRASVAALAWPGKGGRCPAGGTCSHPGSCVSACRLKMHRCRAVRCTAARRHTQSHHRVWGRGVHHPDILHAYRACRACDAPHHL